MYRDHLGMYLSVPRKNADGSGDAVGSRILVITLLVVPCTLLVVRYSRSAGGTSDGGGVSFLPRHHFLRQRAARSTSRCSDLLIVGPSLHFTVLGPSFHFFVSPPPLHFTVFRRVPPTLWFVVFPLHISVNEVATRSQKKKYMGLRRKVMYRDHLGMYLSVPASKKKCGRIW
jgi:hypothetical protein